MQEFVSYQVCTYVKFVGRQGDVRAKIAPSHRHIGVLPYDYVRKCKERFDIDINDQTFLIFTDTDSGTSKSLRKKSPKSPKYKL